MLTLPGFEVVANNYCGSGGTVIYCDCRYGVLYKGRVITIAAYLARN